MSRRHRRNTEGKFARKHSVKFISFSWLASLLSLGLLWLFGRAVLSDFSSFRSCSTNSSGLAVANCGKQSLNVGDFVILGLFALTACLVVSLFTAAWRMTRGTAG